MTSTMQRLQRTVFFSTLIVLAITLPGYAQLKFKVPPGVDYPRDNVTSAAGTASTIWASNASPTVVADRRSLRRNRS